MADINFNDPSTFNVSSPNSRFAGSYYYTIAVTPSNPSTYGGPAFYTVTSNSLLSEEEILSLAEGMNRVGSCQNRDGQELTFEVVAATINHNLV